MKLNVDKLKEILESKNMSQTELADKIEVSKGAINLLYWTGMRKGELYALTWDKLVLDNKTILIDRSLQRLKGESIVTMTKKHMRVGSSNYLALL